MKRKWEMLQDYDSQVMFGRRYFSKELMYGLARVANPRLSYARVIIAVVESVSMDCQYINQNGAFVAADAVIGEGSITEPGFWLIAQSLSVRMYESIQELSSVLSAR